MKSIKTSNRSIKRLVASVFTFMFIAFAIYIVWANFSLSIDEFSYNTDKIIIDKDFKIAHLSDYHNTQSDRLTDDIIDSLIQNKPDVIVLTGDLVDNRRTDASRALEFIGKITEIAPVYYVTGNHEYRVSRDNKDEYKRLIEGVLSYGVIMLDNNEAEITLNNGEIINLFGIKDSYFGSDNYKTSEEIIDDYCSELTINKNELNLLLAHHPEQLDVYSDYGFDLVFSGHAHGGQFRAFDKGFIAPDQGFFPEYTNGIYEKDNTTLVVSRGIGNSIIPIRVFNNPHLIYLNIKNNSLN